MIAYGVSISGNSVSEKWRYKFNEKYTAVGGTNIIDYGGGTAVADVDLDGNNEVITADFGTRTAYDWPGELFVFDGTTGTKEGNATFGNGGAFASVSIANIDDDDNPEIIVPSVYGAFVYDYNKYRKVGDVL